MVRYLVSGLLSVVFVGLSPLPRCSAQEDVKAAPPLLSLNSLSMEVTALQTLHQFRFSKGQMEKLQQLAAGMAPKDDKRKAGRASKEFRAKLQTLRKALTEAKDDARIAKLSAELEMLRDKENPSFDEHADLTDGARKRAVEALRLLKPSQLALVIAHVAEDIADPSERLVDSLEEVRVLSDEEWKEQRDEIATDIGRMVAGLDPVKSKLVGDQVSALLARARSLSKTDFPKQQLELKKTARKIIGDVTALDVVRHQVEVELAYLLVNPRLPQAIRARLK